MSGNAINFLDGRALSKFPRLEYLDLSSNQLTQGSFYADRTRLSSIKVLSLSNNAIDSIKNPELSMFFRALPSLTSLDLSSNSIASNTIPFETFSTFQDLRNLNLSSCNIKDFAKGWLNGGPNATLKVLDISRNLLTSIRANYLSTLDQSASDPQIDTLKCLSIEVLYLNDNYLLSMIEEDAFQFVPYIQLLFLQVNYMLYLNCSIW